MIMLKVKQIFTLKRILISLISLCVMLFFVGGCSFRLMDWQWYQVKNLCKNESGIYIVNKELYEDMITHNLQDNKYTRKMEEFSKTVYERYQSINSRIYKLDDRKYYYYDMTKNKSYVVSFERNFAYKNYGIFLTGDEGRGFEMKSSEILECFNRNNTFLVKE